MAAVLIRRSFPGLSRVAAFTTRRTGASGRREHEREERPAGAGAGAERGAASRPPNPAGCSVSSDPRAGSRAASQRFGAARRAPGLGSAGAGWIRRTVSTTSAQAEPAPRNALPDTTFKPLLEQDISAPAKEEAEKERAEMHDSKEDPRTFQKGRPEYQSLSYNTQEPIEALPAEEGEAILRRVSACGDSESPDALAGYLCRLSRLPAERRAALRSDPRFGSLCRGAARALRSCSTPQLLDTLKALVRVGAPAALPALRACESECCRRAWDMDVEQLLLVADCWRCLERSVPSYLSILFSFANVHWKDLTLPQVVQLIYIIGEGRKSPADLVQKLESLILKYLDAFTLEEVGAVCLGLFKSISGISDHVMKKIADRVALQMEDMSSYALVNVLKMLRYSRMDHLPLLRQLGKVIPPRIPTINIQGIMHVALACSSLHYYNEDILAAVAAALPSKVTYCRSKDAAKFLWSFGCLDYEPPNEEQFYSSLIEQMHRKLHEFEKFPEHLLTGLLGLAFVQRFPANLIDFALSAEFVQKTRESKYELGKDLLTLSKSVEIECPGYKGSRLSPQLSKEITEMVLNFAEEEIYVRPEIVEAVSLLESVLGGPEYVKSHMLLPHTRSSDLEVRLALDGHPVPFNFSGAAAHKHLQDIGVSLTDDLLTQLIKGRPGGRAPAEAGHEARTGGGERVEAAQAVGHTPGAPGARLEVLPKSQRSLDGPFPPAPAQQPREVKLALQVSNRNHYCYCSKRLLGLHSLKRRQLRRLGYVPVELPFWEWFPLLKRTRSEKLSYLHYKVFNPALLRGAG
ncbi:FAKD5 protein, partial [Nothoprocta ornata]|nr:FAKD5 protein [Nothoprocta ornata]